MRDISNLHQGSHIHLDVHVHVHDIDTHCPRRPILQYLDHSGLNK